MRESSHLPELTQHINETLFEVEESEETTARIVPKIDGVKQPKLTAFNPGITS